MPAPSHQGIYRNSPLIFGGLLGSIALLAAAILVMLPIGLCWMLRHSGQRLV